jgi:hypothetical protein
MLHLTLSTDHRRDSPREEVRDDILAELRPLIVRALRGEHAPIPRVEPRCTLTGGRSVRESRVALRPGRGPRHHLRREAPRDVRRPVYGEAIALTVWGPPDVTGLRPPIVTLGIAPSISGAGDLWRELHRPTPGSVLVTSADEMPEPPWCAARVDIGAAVYPAALEWTGDLERCLFWAWATGEL